VDDVVRRVGDRQRWPGKDFRESREHGKRAGAAILAAILGARSAPTSAPSARRGRGSKNPRGGNPARWRRRGWESPRSARATALHGPRARDVVFGLDELGLEREVFALV
jgi:hypothetical protein